MTIPVKIDYLFSNHGWVTPAMLLQEEKVVKEMFYDPTHHIKVIFNKVEDLSDLAATAQAGYTKQQLINISYVIINNTRKYQTHIQEWSKLPQDQHTWANFKTHFHRAHQELKEAGDLRIRETQFNSANIVQEVIDGVQSVLKPPEPAPDAANDIINHMANNAAQQQMVPQIMNQMVQIIQQMSTVPQQIQQQASTTSSITSTNSS